MVQNWYCSTLQVLGGTEVKGKVTFCRQQIDNWRGMFSE